MTTLKPSKLEVFRALLQKGAVFVHLDPKLGGCTIPQHLQNNTQVVLQLGLDMPVPIPDLYYTEIHVSGTLSFKGKPFHVSIPWEAVFALVGEDTRGIVWEEKMPQDLLQRAQGVNTGKVAMIGQAKRRQSSAPVASKPGASRAHLKLVN